jgi:hypothetical protein
MASGNPLSPIPHPPKKPVVGNMFSVDAKAPTQSLSGIAKELGPIFWLDLLRRSPSYRASTSSTNCPMRSGSTRRVRGSGDRRRRALRRDHVRDREGRDHDIVMVGYDVAKVAAQFRAYGVTS